MDKRKFLRSFWTLPLIIPSIISAEEKEESLLKANKNKDGSINLTLDGTKIFDIKDEIINSTECVNNEFRNITKKANS